MKQHTRESSNFRSGHSGLAWVTATMAFCASLLLLLALLFVLNVAALEQILGPDSRDIIYTGETVRDREQASEFAKQARQKNHITTDRRTRSRAFLLIGDEDWPFPIPIVKKASKWSFDAKAGR